MGEKGERKMMWAENKGNNEDEEARRWRVEKRRKTRRLKRRESRRR